MTAISPSSTPDTHSGLVPRQLSCTNGLARLLPKPGLVGYGETPPQRAEWERATHGGEEYPSQMPGGADVRYVYHGPPSVGTVESTPVLSDLSRAPRERHPGRSSAAYLIHAGSPVTKMLCRQVLWAQSPLVS